MKSSSFRSTASIAAQTSPARFQARNGMHRSSTGPGLPTSLPFQSTPTGLCGSEVLCHLAMAATLWTSKHRTGSRTRFRRAKKLLPTECRRTPFAPLETRRHTRSQEVQATCSSSPWILQRAYQELQGPSREISTWTSETQGGVWGSLRHHAVWFGEWTSVVWCLKLEWLV